MILTVYDKINKFLAQNGAIVKIRNLYEFIEKESNLEVVVSQNVQEVLKNGAITLFEAKDTYGILLNLQIEAVEENENSSLDSLVEIKEVLINIYTKKD